MCKKILLMLVFIFLLIGCTPEESVTYEMRLNSGMDTINLGDTWVDSGAVVDLGGSVVIGETNDTVDTSTLGIYMVTYTATYEGTDYEIIRYVMVTDLEAPVMMLNVGIDTVVLGSNWIDSGVNVSDNLDDDVTIEVTGSVDTNTVGDYMITYQATDDYGNVSYLIRMVSVIE